MNPIFIKVEKNDNGKYGVQVTHPPSHYMDGDERVEVPSRKTWLGHDGQDMMYGTGIEFETENEAKNFMGQKRDELIERAKSGTKVDINCYLLIHHDAVIKWDGYIYQGKPIEEKPVVDVVKEIPVDMVKDLKEHFDKPVQVIQAKASDVKSSFEYPEKLMTDLKSFTDDLAKPRTALFIKSYKPDFVWLAYALKSIKKFCTGYHEVVIVVPNQDLEEAKKLVTDEKLIGIDEPPNGYLFQQVVKLNAHKYTDCELIQYHDSDCIFITPTSPSDYMEDGKPWMYCTPYEKCDTAQMWKEPTEKALGVSVSLEFMRRIQFVYFRESLIRLHEKYPNINQHIMAQPGRHFSEFNFLGGYVYNFEPNNYIWKNTDEHPLVPERLRQFHSYSEYNAQNIEWMENQIK